MEYKGIFTKQQEKAIAEAIDGAIKFKGLAEVIDGYMAKALVSVLDDSLLERINMSQEIKESLGRLADATIAKDVDTVEVLCSVLINDLVDVPGIDEDAEAVIFSGVVQIIVGSAKAYLKK